MYDAFHARPSPGKADHAPPRLFSRAGYTTRRSNLETAPVEHFSRIRRRHDAAFRCWRVCVELAALRSGNDAGQLRNRLETGRCTWLGVSAAQPVARGRPAHCDDI